METVCIRTKIKKGALDGVKEWFQTLRQRPDEVMLTLKNEGVFIESAFLDKFGEDHYLIYYMKAENLAYAKEVALKSMLEIDKYHKDCFSKYCEGRVELEQLIDFYRN